MIDVEGIRQYYDADLSDAPMSIRSASKDYLEMAWGINKILYPSTASIVADEKGIMEMLSGTSRLRRIFSAKPDKKFLSKDLKEAIKDFYYMNIMVGDGFHRPWVSEALGEDFREFVFKRSVPDMDLLLPKIDRVYKAEIIRPNGWGFDHFNVAYKHSGDYCNALVLGPPKEEFFPFKKPEVVLYSCRNCSQIIDVLK